MTSSPNFHQNHFPDNIHCLTTAKTIFDGVGIDGYSNFNLATHSGDNLDSVNHNRQLLQKIYKLPSEPKWLNQIHSNTCLLAQNIHNTPNADASWTDKPKTVCVVLTADCLPIFISNQSGTKVGMIHAGYQGLLNGVIENFIKTSAINPTKMLVFMGTGIGQDALSLDQKMYQQFINKDKQYQTCFVKKETLYHLNMTQLANLIFNKNKIYAIQNNNGCTYNQQDDYFSYRRQGAKSGRMASLIWMD